MKQSGSLHLVDHSASSSAAPLSCEYALESSQIPLDISRTVQTALDIPLTDTVARQLPSNGLLTTVHLTDCGLVWSTRLQEDSPQKERAPDEQTDTESDTDSDQQQMQMMGLPTAFGLKAKRKRRKQVRQSSASAQASDGQDPSLDIVQPGDESRQLASSVVPLAKLDWVWEQAWDAQYGVCYYYRESIQETQWEVPAAGYIPMSWPLDDSQHYQPHEGQSSHHGSHSSHQGRPESTGLFPYLPEPAGVHTYFNDSSPSPLATDPQSQHFNGSDELVLDAEASPRAAALEHGPQPGPAHEGSESQADAMLAELALEDVVEHTAGVSLPDKRSDQPATNGKQQAVKEGGRLRHSLVRYWLQRYSLWRRFDAGIVMDEEGWFSVTPEVLAMHQAGRCKGAVAVDAFAGVGGNCVAMARAGCQRVIAVELSEQRLRLLSRNAAVYGAAGPIVPICGNFFNIAPRLQADAVFMSPPWGGPAYHRGQSIFDVNSMPGIATGLQGLIAAAAAALRPACTGVLGEGCPGTIAIFLPRHSSMQQISQAVPAGARWEVERAVLNQRLKGITLYLWL